MAKLSLRECFMPREHTMLPSEPRSSDELRQEKLQRTEKKIRSYDVFGTFEDPSKRAPMPWVEKYDDPKEWEKDD